MKTEIIAIIKWQYWLFNHGDVDEIHYVYNDGISDDNKPIKIYKKNDTRRT